MPCPSPAAPWQIAQLSRKTRSPSAGSADCPEALAASPRAAATRAKAPGRRDKNLLENDELTRHMGRMQLTLDRKDARLVRDELHVRRLLARHHFLHVERGNLEAVLVGVPVHELEHDGVALLRDDRCRLPDLHVLRRDDVDDAQ